MRSQIRFASFALLIFFFFFVKIANAQDVAILWDISLSVNYKGISPYSQEFHQAVRDLLLSGHAVDENVWTVVKPDPYPSELAQVLGGARPIIGEASNVLVVRFGSLKRARYPNLPYFDSTLITRQHGKDIASDLVASFPSTAPENMTNNELAQAAAARYFYDSGSKGWYLVTISDFKSDAEKLTPAETALIDQFTAGRIAVRSRPAVLRLRQTPQVAVQVEFHGRSTEAPLPPPPSRSLELTSPHEGSTIQKGIRPTFSWVWSAPLSEEGAQLQQFSIVVTERITGKPVLQKLVSQNSLVAEKSLPAGDYSWQVFARFGRGANDGQLAPVASTPSHFHVASDPFSLLPWIVGIALIVGSAVVWRRIQANRRPA